MYTHVGVLGNTRGYGSSLNNGLYSAFQANTIGSNTLNQNLIASYSFESNVNDSISGLNGTAQGGLVYASGKIGNGIRFNNTNAYVSLPTNAFNFTGDYSISASVYIPSGYTGSNQVIILCNEYVSSYFTNPYGWYLTTVGNTIYHETHVGTNTTTNLIASYTFTPGNWYNILYTRKAGTRSRIYVNGTLINSDTNTIDPVYSTTHNPTIGAEYLAGAIHDNSVANSMVDELKIWNRELTAAEALTLHNNTLGCTVSNSLFLLPTTNDSLGVNNATANGGLTYSSGINGLSFYMDGSTSYLTLPTNSINFTGDFTIIGWVYIPSGYIGTNYIHLISNMWAPSWANNFKGFRLFLCGNSINFDICDGSSYNGNSGMYELTYNLPGGGFTTSNWYQIGVVRQASVGSTIYLNGVAVTSDTNTVNPIYNSTMLPTIGNLYISGVQNGYYSPAGTKQDELYFYQRALSASEMALSYNSSVGKFYPNF